LDGCRGAGFWNFGNCCLRLVDGEEFSKKVVILVAQYHLSLRGSSSAARPKIFASQPAWTRHNVPRGPSHLALCVASRDLRKERIDCWHESVRINGIVETLDYLHRTSVTPLRILLVVGYFRIPNNIEDVIFPAPFQLGSATTFSCVVSESS
jgi:hypothetical protein